MIRLASATISSTLLFSRLTGLFGHGAVEPGEKLDALPPFPKRADLDPISHMVNCAHYSRLRTWIDSDHSLGATHFPATWVLGSVLIWRWRLVPHRDDDTRIRAIVWLLGRRRDHGFRFDDGCRTEIIEPSINLLLDYAWLGVHEHFDSHRSRHVTRSFGPPIPLPTIPDPSRLPPLPA